MSLIPIDEVVYFDAITSTPSTSAAVDADSAPTFAVYEEATDTAILDAQTMTKRTALTGNYRGTVTASAANGFEAGKWYSVVATGIVGGVTGKCVVKNFRIVPAESSAGVPKVDATHFGGTAGTFAAGIPETKVASLAAGAITAAAIATDAIDADALATDAITEIQSGLSTLNAAGVRTAVGLASANLDTQLGDLPTATENATALLDLAAGVETGLTLRQAMRLLAAASAGKLSGAATTTITVRNAVADSKDRITATVTSDGDRSAITYDLT